MSADEMNQLDQNLETFSISQHGSRMGRRLVCYESKPLWDLFDDKDYALVDAETCKDNLFYSLYVLISQKLLSVTLVDGIWMLEKDALGYNHETFPNWDKYASDINAYLNEIEEVEVYEMGATRPFSIYGYNIWQKDDSKRIPMCDYKVYKHVQTYLTVMVEGKPMHCIAMSSIKHIMTQEAYKGLEKPPLELLTIDGDLYSVYQAKMNKGVDRKTLDDAWVEVPSDSKVMEMWALVSKRDMVSFLKTNTDEGWCMAEANAISCSESYVLRCQEEGGAAFKRRVNALLDWLVEVKYNTPLSKICQHGDTIELSFYFMGAMLNEGHVPMWRAHIEQVITTINSYNKEKRTNVIEERNVNVMTCVHDLLFTGIEGVSKKISE